MECWIRSRCAACGVLIFESDQPSEPPVVMRGGTVEYEVCDDCARPIADAIRERWGGGVWDLLLRRARMSRRANEVRANGLAHAEHLTGRRRFGGWEEAYDVAGLRTVEA